MIESARFSHCRNPGIDDLKTRMISDAERSAGIVQRFENKDPLNLSAIAVECPWLLEGLFQAKRFKGWRESIELAGVAIGEIRIEPIGSVTCEECGFIGETLWSHLAHAHGMNAADYRDAHPAAESSSEAHRARMMADRHGFPAKTLMSHWEPAWSRNYALDRIHQFSKQGIPLNYSYLARHEPGLPAYVRRIFPSWDEGLAAAGINVEKTRLAKEPTHLSVDQLLELLQKDEKERPAQLHIRAARSATCKTAITAAFRHFGSYENALTAAGIDPLTKIPALKNRAKLKARDKLLSEISEGMKKRLPYDPVNAKKFIDLHSPSIKDFYGSWANFATSLGLVERDLFNSPDHRIYDSKAACITALQERAKVGLSLRQADVRVDNPSLEIMGQKHFGNHAHALKEAAVQRLPRSIAMRDYASGDELLAEIRRRYQKGETLYQTDLDRNGSARTLIRWSSRYFGSYSNALVAAGVPHPGSKPSNLK